MFEISAEADSPSDAGIVNPGQVAGRIVIGDFVEGFSIPLGYWSVEDYRKSWCAALKVLESEERAVSCLVVSMTDPTTTNFIFCWPLYRDSDVVHIQNSIIFLEEVESFDPRSPWLSVRPRETINEDGHVISEWVTDMDSIRHFCRSIC